MKAEKLWLQGWKGFSNLNKINRIKDVFESKAPALSVLKKEKGLDFIITYLALWISEINKFCGGKMTEQCCLEASEMIYEDFYFLNLADLKLITKNLKKKKFVRVSGNEIYTEINNYFEKRCEHAQAYSKQISDKNKKQFLIDELNNEEIKKLYNEVKKGKKLTSPFDLKTQKEQKLIIARENLKKLRDKEHAEKVEEFKNKHTKTD